MVVFAFCVVAGSPCVCFFFVQKVLEAEQIATTCNCSVTQQTKQEATLQQVQPAEVISPVRLHMLWTAEPGRGHRKTTHEKEEQSCKQELLPKFGNT